MNELNLTRDAFGKLIFIDRDGQTHVSVVPVHAFPISAPESGISLTSSDGRELMWIDNLNDVSIAARALLRQSLAQREFIPEIKCIRHVVTFALPSTWQIETDRGDYALVLKSEDDIRRLAGNALLITDSCGIHFLIRDTRALDKESRRFLDRFL